MTMQWNTRKASDLLKNHTVICPDRSIRLVATASTYGDVIEVRFSDGNDPPFIYVGKEYSFSVLEEEWATLLEEIKQVLPYVGFPTGEYADWLAQDAWKQVNRAESLLSTNKPDAAQIILFLVVQACNKYAMSRRTHFENYAQRLRESAREYINKASQISNSYRERYENLYLETKTLLLRAKAITRGDHHALLDKNRYRKIVLQGKKDVLTKINE